MGRCRQGRRTQEIAMLVEAVVDDIVDVLTDVAA